MNPTRRLFLPLIASAALALSARGQTSYVWRLDASGAWDNAANWQVTSGPGSTFPSVVGDTARFDNFITAARTLTLGTPRTVGSVVFQGAQFSHTVSGAGPLTFDNGGAGPATITADPDTETSQNLTLPMAIADPEGLTVTNNSGSVLNLCVSTTAGITLNTGTNPIFIAGNTQTAIGQSSAANLAGSGTLNVDGTFFLGGNNPGYTGQLRINAGGLATITTNALSGQNAPSAIYLNGGSLFGSGTPSLTNQGISIDTGGGTIRGALTLNNAISGTGALTLLSGGGLVTLNTAAAHAGATNVYGDLTLAGAAGALASTTGLSLRGVFLILDNTVSSNGNRVRDTASLASQGSTINLRNGSSAVAIDELVGAYSLIGLSRLRLTALGTQDVQLSAGNLSNPAGSNLLVTGTNLDRSGAGATARVFFNNGTAVAAQRVGGGGADGTTNISILPWAFATSAGNTTVSVEVATASSLVTYTAAGGVRALTPAELATSITSATVNLQATTGSPVSLPGTATVNALVANPPSALTGAGPLIISSGTLLTTGGVGSLSTPLNFNSRVANIFNNQELTLDGTLTTGLGINKGGPGLLVLTADNSATLGGPITIHEGNLRLTRPEALSASSVISFDGPASTANLQLLFADGASHVFPNAIQLGNVTTNTISPGTVSAPTSLNATIELSGLVSSHPATPAVQTTPLTLTGESTRSNTFRLTNAGNTFRGAVTIGNVTLELGSSAVLGDPANLLSLSNASATAGGLRLTASMTLPRTLLVGSTGRLDTNNFDLNLTGPLTGASTLTKIGAGTLTLAHPANTHSGNITVTNGILAVAGTLRRAASPVTVATGAALTGNGTINRPVTIQTGGTVAPTGTLTVGAALTINGSYACDLSGAGGDRLTGGGNLDLTGATLNVTVGSPLTAPSYTLVSYTGTRTGTFVIGTPLPAGGTIAYDDTNRLVLLVFNNNPVAGDDVMGTRQGVAASVPASRLLLNDSDPDGNPLSVSAVSATSVGGATVTLNAGLVTYSPLASFSGNDSFTYTLSDGLGGSAIGTVNVTVTPSGAGTLNITGVTMPGGVATVEAYGIPNRSYQLEYTDDMGGAWAPLGAPQSASSTGLLLLVDPTPGPLPPQRFYRVLETP